MYRAIFELLITILIIAAARSMLAGLFKGIATGTRTFHNDANQTRDAEPGAASGGGTGKQSSSANELHKDPVCGTYVAESTPHRRSSPGEVFYYCSSKCRDKHAPVAR
jgi:YHS domain-containing protein